MRWFTSHWVFRHWCSSLAWSLHDIIFQEITSAILALFSPHLPSWPSLSLYLYLSICPSDNSLSVLYCCIYSFFFLLLFQPLIVYSLSAQSFFKTESPFIYWCTPPLFVLSKYFEVNRYYYVHLGYTLIFMAGNSLSDVFGGHLVPLSLSHWQCVAYEPKWHSFL